MLNYSDLTVIKTADGISTALGYPVNSILLQNNTPLFMGGGKKPTKRDVFNIAESDQLAVPVGLICMRQTICRDINDINALKTEPEYEHETVPEGLYEQLLALAETKPPKKLSRRNKREGNKAAKRKTKRNK
jgi:hypothetical protein